ncbi:MAG: hypothetical protein H7338_24940 [Candidatus Sericytochromatia bacterium]|nr:hypothetical protein [Candidatus Sericytochromatia bacterium]
MDRWRWRHERTEDETEMAMSGERRQEDETMSSAAGGQFGRIPTDTVALMRRTVTAIRDEVLTGLPSRANDEVRAFTLEQVLQIVLRDWSENENTSGLEATDVADLKSFVALAASLAGDDINQHGLPIFQASLHGLLADWLENWNAAGDPGPPGPVD